MDTVVSADGTPIAYERFGDGPPVVLVGGALCDRTANRPLAEALAPRFSTITYDRRGRGDSGDTPPYAIEREVEDLDALIHTAGGEASVYGHSSGAALVLHAAAQGFPITRAVLHEPPYNPDDDEARQVSRDYVTELDRLLADGRHGEAVELFMATVGAPSEAVQQMRAEPWWPGMVALAPTLAYDSEVMGDRQGGTVPTESVARVRVPALVLCGGTSPAWMAEIGTRMADTMRFGTHAVLNGEEHVVAPEVLAPVLTTFLAG